MKKLTVPMRKHELLLGWIYFVLQATVLPIVIVFANLLLGNPLSEAELNFLFFFMNFACIAFIFWRFLLENAKTAFSDIVGLIASVVISFGLYWILSIAISILNVIIYPEFSNVNDESIGALVQENTGLISFATILLVPITEEVLYRGLVFRGLYNRSRCAGFAVSTLVFAAVHVVGYIGLYEPMHLLLCFLQYLPAGICLGLAYAMSNFIWAPILIHISINMIGILAMR